MAFTGASKVNSNEYSFFVAGHTYGSPSKTAKNRGLYEPFKQKTAYINDQQKMVFGFLLGDVVKNPKFWPPAQRDIADFDMPIHIARGNHDGPLIPFEKKFGKSYKYFSHADDLFIVLDPNLDKWNISGKQLNFLKKVLKTDAQNARNIFVFSHQLLWWSTEKHRNPAPNSRQGRDKEINFWSEIAPLFEATNKKTTFYAGDVGAFSKEKRKAKGIVEYSYFQKNNLTFIATGMGGGVRDNFVITDVSAKGSVSYRLIHLNGDDINSLGGLESGRD